MNNIDNEASQRSMSNRAFNIEKKSFDIIESEIGDHGYSEIEWIIVRRVIHATADFDFARNCKIVFHPLALQSCFDAIKKGCTIVTDVDMVLSAINKKSLEDLKIKAVCHISDSRLKQFSLSENKTRSEISMRFATEQINGGIVAIGNAPTALYELIKMIREKSVRPALVVGIPVGFVSAVESKEELAKTDVPFITNIGRKGGSPVASSIINALMLEYKKRITLKS